MASSKRLGLSDLLAHLASISGQSRDVSRAMPGAFYTSAEFAQLERDTIFRSQWVCIGHEGQVPSSGDYFTTDLVDEPLLVVRDSGGDVRVLSNVCRHRGSTLAHGAGNASRFVCSYHAWTYALDGRLLAAPLMSDGEVFAKKQCALPQLACELWYGYIFVNLDGQAAPLAPALAAAVPNIRNYHPEQQHHLFAAEEVWNTNWKNLVENFMEGYHLSPLHAKTLHPVTPTALCEKLADGPAFTGYRSNFNPQYPERGPFHADLTRQEQRSDVFYCVYPSFVVGFCPNFTLYMCLRPLATGTVGVRWGVTGIADDPESKLVKDYVEFCKQFSAEDRMQMERLQVGLQSRHYVPGPLAPDAFEGTIWDFWQYLSRQLAVAKTLRG